jgi:hypothetical protein
MVLRVVLAVILGALLLAWVAANLYSRARMLGIL